MCLEKGGQGVDVFDTAKSLPAREHNFAADRLVRECAVADQALESLVCGGRKVRNQSISMTGRDKLPQRLDARSVILTQTSPSVFRTQLERLIFQAVAVFEQYHFACPEIPRTERLAAGQRMALRRQEQKRFEEKREEL